MQERFEPGHGEQPWRWHWALPLCPIAAAMFCLSALVYYHTVLGGTGEAWGVFQGVVVALYRWFGFVPTFMFWLLVFVWCSVWFVTGRFARPAVRLSWTGAFALSLAILLNIGTDAVSPPPHAGAVGTFIAVRLASVLGVVFSSLLALGAALAALLLATDFLFYRYFESLARGGGAADAGVEPEATDAFRELAFAGIYTEEPRLAVDGGAAQAPRRRIVLEEADLPDAPTPRPEPVETVDSTVDGADPVEEPAATALPAAMAEPAGPAAIETEEFAFAGEPEPESEPAAMESVGDVAEEPVVELARPPARQQELFARADAPYELPRPVAAPAGDRLLRAAEVVAAAGRASVNLLRRELGCPPSTAQALLDELRETGMVDGEPGASQGRVVATMAQWQAARATDGFSAAPPDAAGAPGDAGTATI